MINITMTAPVNFNNIIDGLAFKKKCPLCNHKLELDQSQIKLNKNLLSFKCWDNSLTSSNVIVNIKTNEVKIKHLPLNCCSYYLYSDCSFCAQYWYSLSITLDPISKTCQSIILEMESIEYKTNNNERYDIIIRYLDNKIAFYYIKNDETLLFTYFPLMPLDLNDITKTIRKLKQLLIFT